MRPFAAMEPERLSFLYEIYTRSAGDARQGVLYEALIDALGFAERGRNASNASLSGQGWWH